MILHNVDTQRRECAWAPALQVLAHHNAHHNANGFDPYREPSRIHAQHNWKTPFFHSSSIDSIVFCLKQLDDSWCNRSQNLNFCDFSCCAVVDLRLSRWLPLLCVLRLDSLRSNSRVPGVITVVDSQATQGITPRPSVDYKGFLCLALNTAHRKGPFSFYSQS